MTFDDNLLSDAHIHLSDFAARFLAAHDVLTIVSTATPEECKTARQLAAANPYVFVSCGIHPWHLPPKNDGGFDMINAINMVDILGEIGLDNVWCDSDLDEQRKWFSGQLKYAINSGRPVVLHIKGMEQEALEILRHHPNTYHVHWYSCPDYLDDYLALGCYMSVGPFPSIDPAVAAVAERTPLDRLLIETDGIDAVHWATGRDVNEDDYPATLVQIASEIAEIRHMTTEDVLRQTRDNLWRFIHSC